jgi:hypothetical protein
METILLEKVQPSHEIERNFELSYEKIEQVYHGRIDACTCGCEGEFYYTKHYAKYKSQVEGNHLLLPMADDKKVERHLKRMMFFHKEYHGRNTSFFVRMGGGYCIKVRTHKKWNDDEGKDVQMGYIINIHWMDINVNGKFGLHGGTLNN